jgi:signal transduction histidine kinase/ActR/RegA family two-component response regulator
VLVGAVVLTIASTYAVLRSTRARDELEFQTRADEMRHSIEVRINTYVELLRSGAAFFSASDEVTGEEFREFTGKIGMSERYPGAQGIGFAMRVTREDVADPGRRLERLALENIRVWPPGDRPEYTSIVFLEPQDRRNRRAMGYDMFTDPVRRAAMEQARDTGEPAASSKVTLVQESNDEPVQAGFLIYVPVYAKGAPVSTVAERRAALTGYVYSPFRIKDLLSGILGPRRTGSIGFQVFDGTSPSLESLLHAEQRFLSPSPHEPLTTRYTLNVANHPWTLEFTGQQHSDSSSPIWLAPSVFVGGITLALALFAVTLWQYRARETAEQHAAQLRTSEEALRESEARLRRLVVLEREARAEAQHANRAKDEFLATLSHELRTPLNAILGWINMMRTGRVREERRAGALEVIERNARAQARLIEDLLDVSRIITGKVRLDTNVLNLGPIVHTVAEGLRPGAEAKHLHLHVEIEPDVGHVLGDSARLQQVIWNLLSNAIKFTPEGGHVFVRLASEGDDIGLTIRDSGVGISADFLPHVFERFRQADSSTTRAHSGVGLGLSIVRHLVELHNGTVSASSEGIGQGSTFVVRLPSAERASAIARAGDHRTRVDLGGLRILVVDDDDDTRDMVTEALRSAGAAVVAAASAHEALAVLERQDADVLISDIGLPNTDGYSLIGRVRAMTGSARRIPAIALTAYAGHEDRQHALDAGYHIHLAKPVELDALFAAIEELKPAIQLR